MVEDHSDSERGNPLPPHGLLFTISSKGSIICIIPDRITHTTAFITPVVEHWLEREIAQWVCHAGSIRRPISQWANALTTEIPLAPTNTFLDGRVLRISRWNRNNGWELTLRDGRWTPFHWFACVWSLLYDKLWNQSCGCHGGTLRLTNTWYS